MGEVLDQLGQRGMTQVMVEGGAGVAGHFLKKGLANHLHVNVGACMLGGTAKPWMDLPFTETIAEAKFWSLNTIKQCGDDVRLEYTLTPDT